MRIALMTLGLLTFTACNGDDPTDTTDTTDSTDSTDSTDDTDVVETVSLETDVMPIVITNCGGCHKRVDGNEGAVRNGAYLEEKGDILGMVGTFIVAGDSANSGFLGVMSGDTPVGAGPTAMPPFGDGVPQADLDTFATWIDEGAKDN
ncbi:MAG: hypothetical protein AB8H79_19970 [Myxococcota bacterium]